jgi:hypothetical protein
MSGSTRYREGSGLPRPRGGPRPTKRFDKYHSTSPRRAAARPGTNGCSTRTPLHRLRATGFREPKTTANSLTSKE